MRAIKEARKFIESNSSSADAITLSRLVLALESEIDFPITDIYLLDYDSSSWPWKSCRSGAWIATLPASPACTMPPCIWPA